MILSAVLKKFSPVLVSAVSSVSPIAGLVVSGLAHLFGVSGSNPDDVANAISSNPDAEAMIKKFEFENSAALAQTEEQDRANARSSFKQDWAPHFLAVFFTFGYVGYIILDIIAPSHFSESLFNRLTALELVIMTFYFGGCYTQWKDKNTKS